MIKSLLISGATALALVVWTSSFIFAQEKDSDEPKNLTFSSPAQGLETLNELIVEIRGKIARSDYEGLHETAEEIEGAADGLAARMIDVSAANKERYKFNTEQLRLLGGQLEEAHEAKNKENAEAVTKRIESVRDRLKSLVGAG